MAIVFRIIKFIVAVGVLFLASSCIAVGVLFLASTYEDPVREKKINLTSYLECLIADPVYAKVVGITFKIPNDRLGSLSFSRENRKSAAWNELPLLSTKNKEVREGYCNGYSAETAIETDRFNFNQSVEEFGLEPEGDNTVEVSIWSTNGDHSYCDGKFAGVTYVPPDDAEEYIPIYSNQIFSEIQPYPGVYSYEWNKNTEYKHAGAGSFWNDSNISHNVAKDALFFNQPFFFKCMNREDNEHFSYSLCFVEQQLNSQSYIRMEFATDLLENKGG